MKIEGYKCPNCAGDVKFDSGVQKMKCPFCDSEFDIEALEELQKEIGGYGEQDSFGWETFEEGGAGNLDLSEDGGLSSGSCPACGAELYGDKNTIATVCPCCGNAQIVAKRLEGVLEPQYIIPFKLKKEDAAGALKTFCKGKRLLPGNYLEDKRVNGMTGVYVPFWLFDARAAGHIRYKATKTKTWSDRNYRYVRTDHYSVIRDGAMDFEKIPVDASEKMDDNYMDAMEPFDYGQMTGFHRSYLAGYLAEKYDVDAGRSKPRAERRIKGTVETEFRKSVKGYATVTPQSSAVKVREAKAAYSLFPVWVFNTKYRNENYQFMMNGQTGRLAGRLPVDNGKAWKYGAALCGIFGIILTVLAFLLLPALTGSAADATAGAQAYIAEGSASAAAAPALKEHLIAAAAAWAIAIAVAASIIQYWKKKMDNVRAQTQATEYAVPGSLSYAVQSDRFLYSRTTRVAKPQHRAKPCTY